MPQITILGLGPGNPAQLTREAWDVLSAAQEVYLRTGKHPTVQAFPPSLVVHTFDRLYEEKDSFEAVYAAIVEEVLRLGKRPEGVVYAVPGHPFVAEATVPPIVGRARAAKIPVRVVEGLSFVEPTARAIGRDLYPHTALVDALEIAALHVPPFPPSAPALIAQLYDRMVASEVKLTLMSVYPDDHRVALIHAAGTENEQVRWMPLYEIDRDPEIGLLTSLYLPALSPDSSFEAFQEVVARLRAPDGCPWDRKQTHRSLRKYLLEETYEALEAIDNADWDALKEELGDILLQILLHSQIAYEEGEFTMTEVLQEIHRKMVRRHPHVFGTVKVRDADEVVRNWEKIKQAEKAEKGEEAAPKSIFDDIPKGLPALVEAHKVQKRAVKEGFEWEKIEDVWAKLAEEEEELRQAKTPEEREAELGDLLFVVTNLARWYGVDSEQALRATNARFRRRFKAIEDEARRQGRPISSMNLAEMQELWEEAKRTEK